MTDIMSQAAEIGRKHGQSAATWVFDGNTSQETYAAVVRMLDAGDPQIYDAYRTPDLSGEFAGEYALDDLQSDLGIEIDWTREDTQEASELLDEAARAWEDAASDAFWAAVETEARRMLTPKN